MRLCSEDISKINALIDSYYPGISFQFTLKPEAYGGRGLHIWQSDLSMIEVYVAVDGTPEDHQYFWVVRISEGAREKLADVSATDAQAGLSLRQDSDKVYWGGEGVEILSQEKKSLMEKLAHEIMSIVKEIDINI